jgi:mono/diheme cytochrome c family protein
MRHRQTFKFILVLLGLACLAGRKEQTVSSAQNDTQALTQQAIALLNARCLQCHGAEPASGLDLRTRKTALKGGSRGPALVAGKPEQSLLIQFVTGKQQPRMPQGGELNNTEIELLRRWIESGAAWAEVTTVASASERPDLYKGRSITAEERNYWTFRKPVKSAVPAVKASAWVKNPIDAFVLAKLEAQDLQPSPPADKRTLLRRVTFDLTGLPPTPEEIKAFLTDAAPDAYEKVVKRLLASPRYGERWAQHWLDVVRFGETNGYELDAEREQSWRYRDYVVNALNADKPYDRFLLEQIAGDELEPNNFELQVATGFLRAGPQHVVAGNQDEALNRQEWLTEALFSVGNTVLGLTVGCARCHDHKFDPIPQADYYRLQAFMAATDNQDFKQNSDAEKQRYDEAVKAHKAKLKPIQDQLKEIEAPYKKQIEDEKRLLLEPKYREALDIPKEKRTPQQQILAKEAARSLDVKYEELLMVLPADVRERRAALRKQMHTVELYAPAPLTKALAVNDKLAPVPVTHVLKGGDPHRLGQVVQPRFPSVLMPPDAPVELSITPVANSTGRRLALAKWLTQKDHPLTSRVMMNRLWQHHFGRGIVATPNDFGRNGQPPTHPELLDWLAVEFTERGWSSKQMHALMVLSNTYQQASAVDAAKQIKDPDIKLLWRMNRQRLDAEAVRDAVLSVAGTLTVEMAGPSIRVPLEPEVYDTIFTEYEPDNLWPVHPDARQHTRRSLYLLRKRNVRLPMLVAYDAPDMMSSCGARNVSVHALQALTLMNSEFMLQQSKALAALTLQNSTNEVQRIRTLFERTLGRLPNLVELQTTRDFLRQQRSLLLGKERRGEKLAQLAAIPKGMNETSVAAWIDLCLATLNLNEFVYMD